MKYFLRKNLGFIVIIILAAVIPLILWLLMKPLNLRFSSWPIFFTSLGQILGLIGAVLFSLNLFLNTRLKIIEKTFQGVNHAYIWHHNLGAIAFSLLLFHPIALVVKSLFISAPFAFNFLVFSGFPVLIGEAALLVMIFALVITFFVRLPYEKWKFFHRFLAIAFSLALIHVLLISSDISRSMILRIYIFAMMMPGLISISYRTFFRDFLIKKHKYTVESVNLVSENVLEVNMTPVNKPISFIPGQFLFIDFKDKTVGVESHPFSMTSTGGEKLSLVIKDLGDFTSRLRLLKKGTLAKIEGPFGKFSYKNYDNPNQIWVAGGIGITPFLSMARSLKPDDSYNIDLYYSVKDEAESVFMDELQLISGKIKNFKVISHISDKSGFLTAEMINKNSSLNNKEIFICGPLAMMKSLERQMIGLGVKSRNIHIEEFKLY